METKDLGRDPSGQALPPTAPEPFGLSPSGNDPSRWVWRPIDTAPMDGTVIIVANHHAVCPAYFAGDKERCWRNWYKGCRYEYVHLGTDCFLPERVWFEPTQWVSLPRPTKPAPDDVTH